MFCVDWVAPKYLVHSYTLGGGSHIPHHNPVSLLLLFLPFFLTAASGAHLQYGSTSLFDSPSMVALTVGMRVNVSCLQATGPVPTSIEWYNPQGQLVSNDSGDEVNQQASGGARAVRLNIRSYQLSQGGKYECRVAGPGNNTESLFVCIGERYIFYWLSSLQLAIVFFSLYQVPRSCHGNPYFGDMCQSPFSGCHLQSLHVHKGTTVVSVIYTVILHVF